MAVKRSCLWFMNKLYHFDTSVLRRKNTIDKISRERIGQMADEKKSDRLKMVEAAFGPNSPRRRRQKLQIAVLERELQLEKIRAIVRAGIKFTALPKPDSSESDQTRP